MQLLATSQVKYIINNDTYVCYTLDENRRIALEFINGDRSKELYDNCSETNRILTKTIVVLKAREDSSATVIDHLEKSYLNCYTTVDKVEANNHRLKIKFNISLGIIGVLLLIIVL